MQKKYTIVVSLFCSGYSRRWIRGVMEDIADIYNDVIGVKIKELSDGGWDGEITLHYYTKETNREVELLLKNTIREWGGMIIDKGVEVPIP